VIDLRPNVVGPVVERPGYYLDKQPNNLGWVKVIDGAVAAIDKKLEREDVANNSLEHPTGVLARRNDTHLGYQVFRPPPPVERRRRWNPGACIMRPPLVCFGGGRGMEVNIHKPPASP
jgi:hypothetical protein